MTLSAPTNDFTEFITCSQCNEKLSKTKEYFYFTPRGKENKLYCSPTCRKCQLENHKRHYYLHREVKLEQKREWDINHPGAKRIASRKFGKSVKGKYSRMLGKNKGLIFNLSDFEKWYGSQEKKCIYCGIKEEDLYKTNDTYNGKVQILTIDRIDNSKKYELDNMGLACFRCNLIKNDFFTYDEMKTIGKELVKPKWVEKGIDVS